MERQWIKRSDAERFTAFVRELRKRGLERYSVQYEELGEDERISAGLVDNLYFLQARIIPVFPK